MAKEMERYVAACDYPGTLNHKKVAKNLAAYLEAVGMQRKIVQLMPDWTIEGQPALARSVNWILDDFAKRNPKAARAARDARDARDALDALDALDARDALVSPIQRFAAWCIQARGWWYWNWDLSWIVATYFGAKQNGSDKELQWSQPLLEAYIAGAWLLYWTDDTLYWVAKPTVHVEKIPNGRRLHNETYAALESDVENLYFWHGVMVPAFVVVRPDWITVKHIDTEENAEVRRVMTTRYGYARYIKDSGADLVHELPDNYYLKGLQNAKLFRKKRSGDSDIVMVSVKNSTPEPDGSIKDYFLRVDPNAYDGLASKDCLAAIASTWRNDDGSLYFARPQDYKPVIET